MYRYSVLSKWVGWGGGWGSEDDIADILDDMAAHGYRLVSTKASYCWWWLIFPWPRQKLLMIFERPADARDEVEEESVA